MALRWKNPGIPEGGQSGRSTQKPEFFSNFQRGPVFVPPPLVDSGMSESSLPASALHPAIKALLAGIRTGEPKVHNGLGLWPVFADCPPEPSYLTLVEALSLDGFKITEISEGGSVPNLRVINQTPQHILLFDGEKLEGAVLEEIELVHVAA